MTEHDNPLDGRWIDCSRGLDPQTPVWPGDRPFDLKQERASDFVLSSFTTTCHVGTHVDAPLHLGSGHAAVETIPLALFLGPAEVVASSGGAAVVDRSTLPDGWTPQASRVLVRTGSHGVGQAVGPSYVPLAVGLGRWLADRGVTLIGVDTPSVDPFDAPGLPVHRELLECGMTWIEGLDLAGVVPGLYLMVALPMALVGTEAAPIRVILRSEG